MNFWNYIDLVPPILLIVNISFSISEQLGLKSDKSLDVLLQTITTFLMWFKLLYFLRIFENTGYLIRMIFVVIYDMKIFFLVLLLTLTAFSDSISVISQASEDENLVFTRGFFTSIIYTYRIALGDFSFDDFNNAQYSSQLGVGLLLLCTLFNMIVMLNLLIAIISESFAKVNNNIVQAVYQEKAMMIAENSYLIPDSVKNSYAIQGQHILFITNLEKVQEDLRDPVLQQIDELQE